MTSANSSWVNSASDPAPTGGVLSKDSARPAGGAGGSFWREQRAITGRRLPVAALAVLVYFLYDVVGTAICIQREQAVTFAGNEENALSFGLRGAQIVSNWMGFRGIGWLIACAGAVLLAIQGFAYLYKSQTVDFYESRPEKRSARFFHIVANSILIYAIPSFLGVVAAFLLAVVNSCWGGWLLQELMLTWLFQTALFLAMYAMSALAALLAGTVVTAILMVAYFFGIEALLRITLHYHMDAYFATFDGGHTGGLSTWTLPFMHYLRGILTAEVYNGLARDYLAPVMRAAIPSQLPGFLINLLIFALAIAAAFLVHRARKAEFAGRAVTYRPVAVFIKFTAGVLFSLLAGLFVYWIFDSRRGAELPSVVLTILVTVFVGCAVLETIFAFNIRQALHRFYQVPIIAAIALVVLFLYRMDAFGYDRWVPDADAVGSAFLVSNRYDNAAYDMDTGDYIAMRTLCERNMYLTDIDDLRTLAGIGQAQRVAVTRASAQVDTTAGAYRGWNSWSATIGWRLKNGRTVTRNILIPESIDPALMDRIISEESFYNTVYQIYDTDTILKIARERSGNARLGLLCRTEHGATSGDGALFAGFLEAYRRDLTAHYDFTLASNEAPVGVVELVTVNSLRYYFGITYPLFDCYEESIAFLAQNGLWRGGFLAPEEISVINVQFTGTTATTDENGETVYTEKLVTESYEDPAQIAVLMDSLFPMNFYSAWQRSGMFEDGNPENPEFDGSWNVWVFPVDQDADREPGDNSRISYSYAFRKGQVPDFVKRLAE